MTEILGIVGSARPWGNSELLVRQTLRGARAEGAVVQMVRLTGLRIEPCTGCLRCVIRGRPCHLDDDMPWLIQLLQGADGLVLAVPTYFLGAAAAIKLVLDRLMMVAGCVDEPLPPRRPAVTIATAGLEGWRGVALPFLNALAASFGYRPIESLVAVAPGPGEILLDEELMARILTAGHRLGRGELEPNSPPPNVCPICYGDSFVLEGTRATCPICACEAKVEHTGVGLRLRFEPPSDDDQRWTPEGMRKHMVDWVMATGPRFLTRYPEIRARRKPYRQMGVEWLCPPSAERGDRP
jgi:NAD(P)H-dependent FMN reductase